jgi:hypothetical protein
MKLSVWAAQEGIAYKTAWRMWKSGKMPVPAHQLPTGTLIVGVDGPDASVALYARVSSSDQKADLDRHDDVVRDLHEVIVSMCTASAPQFIAPTKPSQPSRAMTLRPEHPIFTYQSRLGLDEVQAAALDAYAELYGRAERSLFAALQAGGKLNDLKRDFLPRFGITARQFNAVRIGLEGKIDSIKQRRPELIAEAQARIKKALKVIARLTGKAPGSDKLHQKKRRLILLQSRLSAMQADQALGQVRLCFGSKKLFHAQFRLEANGYASHQEWKQDWLAERASQFFVLGSKDETAGCQGCQAAVAEDGSLELTLRLPDALSRSAPAQA